MFLKTNLITSISVVVIFLAITNIGLPKNESYLDSLEGKFALQFQITDNFSLSNFQGTILSGKYNFSNRDAIRLGVSVEYTDLNSDGTRSRPDTNLVDTNSRTTNGFNIVINAQYLYTLTVLNDIGFFMGVGPFLKYEDNKIEEKGTYYQTETYRTETRKNYGIGMDVISGVEWMFNKSMSLSAEYGIRFIYLNSELVDDRGDYRQTTNQDNFSIYGNNVKFGITVYF